ncbi:hypothetical protein [Bacteroides xylanisolvens]|uniref:DUF551 domain-containing protein n=1 Tax=Bacteroides xylanisolvens TaxID=371601 RepID=A0A1Y4V4Y1_9BACE|nr:hypothetical protein [Bacteroides xylanisolvens]OUQ64588.1 hypothetical protein B5E52_16770 [Bacteroides xylanisolvens]
MKQKLEEAAYDYATNKTKFRKEVLKEVDSDNYVSRKSDCMEDFQCGAEWHAKQSPWIRVEDKDGCDTSDDCVVMTKNFEIFKAYFSSKNQWMKSNGGYYDEVIDDVICWMPIPSFDEILEANRDVLERIKEKGD